MCGPENCKKSHLPSAHANSPSFFSTIRINVFSSIQYLLRIAASVIRRIPFADRSLGKSFSASRHVTQKGYRNGNRHLKCITAKPTYNYKSINNLMSKDSLCPFWITILSYEEDRLH